jgi:hypothetical protein
MTGMRCTYQTIIPEFGGERTAQIALIDSFRETRLTNQEEMATINMGVCRLRAQTKINGYTFGGQDVGRHDARLFACRIERKMINDR